MYGLIHRHKKIAVIVIGIASIAFLLWMFSAADIREMTGGSKACIVNVGKNCVTLREFKIELLRSPFQENTPEVRRQLAENLAIRELLYQKAKEIGLYTSNKEIFEVIQNDPSFQEGGSFSSVRYKNILASLNIMPEEYEEYLRKILTVNKLIDLIGNGIYITEEEEDMQIKLRSLRIEGKAYRIDKSTVKIKYEPGEEEIKRFYEDNKDMFYEEPKTTVKVWITEDKEKAADIYIRVKAGEEPEGYRIFEENNMEKLPDKIKKRLEREDYKYDLRKIGNRFYIVKVIREEKGRLRSLEEVKNLIINKLKEEKALELLYKEAESIKERLKRGESVNLPSLNISNTPIDQLPFLVGADERDLINIINGKEKVYGPFKSGNSYFVLQVKSRKYKNLQEEEIERIRQDLFLIKRSALIDLLVKDLKEKTDIEFNMDILR